MRDGKVSEPTNRKKHFLAPTPPTPGQGERAGLLLSYPSMIRKGHHSETPKVTFESRDLR